ncbi:MAG TPA: hypothetical protein VEA38_13850 [Terriglobales bacterium]|nr:hypothetical protein [Terriglobales bacterium]
MNRKKKPEAWPVWLVSVQNDYTSDRIVGLYWTEAEARTAAAAEGEHAYADVECYEIEAKPPRGGAA